MHGYEPWLEAHLASFFEQDYPEYEILFCARTETDAGLETARRVAAEYPNIPVDFFATGEPPYINAKVASMEMMEADAAHDILVISDSDVRVTPDYLRAVALPFADEKVGAMYCPYRGVAAEGGLWARLEAVGMSVEMTAGVLVARMMEGMQFTLGPTMAFRREAIRRMGGFKVTADYCADDFVLGNETFKLGQTVVLSHSRDRSHGDEFELLVVDEAPGAMDEVDAVLAAEGALWDCADVQHSVRVAGACGGSVDGPCGWGVALFAWSVATRLALSIAVGRLVVRRSKLVWTAGALSVARFDGIWVLGGELYGQSHSVARTDVSVAAGWEDAGGEIGWKDIQDRKR